MKKRTFKVTAVAAALLLLASGSAFSQTPWDLNGNIVTDTSFIGSKNAKGLSFKTDDHVRMQISKDGDIDMYGNTNVTGHLRVDSATIHGPLIITSDTGSFYFDPNLPTPAPAHDRMRVSTGIFTIMRGANIFGFPFANSFVNTGMGTETPNSKLHLYTSGSTDVYSLYTNGANSNNTTGFQLGIAASGDAILNQRQNLPMMFYTNTLERMRILANGNIGINTTTSSFSKLTVSNSTEMNTGYFISNNPSSTAVVNAFYNGAATTTNLAAVQGTAVTVNGSGGVFFGGKVGASGTAMSSSTSSQAIGVVGNSTGAATNYGLHGFANSSGTGIVMNYGVKGEASGGSQQNVALFGNIGGSSGQSNFGVVAYSQGGSFASMGGAFLASGTTNNTGVSGQATGGTINHGIYGDGGAPSSTNFAGYFSGDIKVNSTVYTSDSGLKDNVTSISNALYTLSQLNPVSYNFKTSQHSYMNLQGGRHYGLISQEVEQVLPDIVEDVVHPEKRDTNNNTISPRLEYKGLEYIELIPFLIQAVKELDRRTYCVKCEEGFQPDSSSNRMHMNNTGEKTVSDLERVIGNLEAENEALEMRLNAIEKLLAQKDSPQSAVAKQEIQLLPNSVVLEQNVPNPFAENTVISYFIPESTGFAQIIFHDSLGKVLKVVDIEEKGAGQLTVFAGSIGNGTYTYSLVLDGKIADVKKMIKSN